MARKTNSYLVLGHHSEDYLESVLIHWIRGGGFKVLQTLKPLDGLLFRPMVYLKKQERVFLENLWQEEIFIDETNDSEQFLRNRLRQKILPLLVEEGLDIDKLYFNFHHEPICQLGDSKIPSYCRIDPFSIYNISLSKLKNIIDSYLAILHLYPLTRNLLSELWQHLKNGRSFTIANQKTLFWKGQKGYLYIIPINSPCLRLPGIIQKDNKKYISWNGNLLELEKTDQLVTYSAGLRIQVNGIHKKVKEILRLHNIPVPVRKFFPIQIDSAGRVKMILFSLWDPCQQNYPS